MTRVRHIANRFPVLSRCGGLLTLLMLGLLVAAVPGSAPNLGIGGQAATSDIDEDAIGGEDLFSLLSFDGVEPSATFPETQQASATSSALTTAKIPLPSRVNNMENKFFPPIMAQKGGSCAQASGIHYNFTYEMNIARNLDARLIQNQYPDHWTWNCLNGAAGKGSNYQKGWAVVKEIGVPTLDVYGDKFGLHADYGWPTGYEKYYAAMKNRVDSYGSMPIKTPADLEKIKGYLLNHNDPNQKYGGLLSYSLNSKGRKYEKIPAGFHEAGKSLVREWGSTGAHAMTIVGYDDDVCWDVNKDGKITNDVDLNGDGKIDMADWERGAFIWVDSHGAREGDAGKGYSLYRLTQVKKELGGQTPSGFWVKVKKDYQPRVTIMLKLSFDERSSLTLSTGFASHPDETKPAKTFAPGVYNGKYNVGKAPLRGNKNSEPIEIGLDLTDIAAADLQGKFFLNLGRKKDTTAKGELLAACIYHYDAQGRITNVHNFTITDGAFGEKSLALTLNTK